MGTNSNGPETPMPALLTNPAKPRSPICSLICAAVAAIDALIGNIDHYRRQKRRSFCSQPLAGRFCANSGKNLKTAPVEFQRASLAYAGRCAGNQNRGMVDCFDDMTYLFVLSLLSALGASFPSLNDEIILAQLRSTTTGRGFTII